MRNMKPLGLKDLPSATLPLNYCMIQLFSFERGALALPDHLSNGMTGPYCSQGFLQPSGKDGLS